MKWQEFKNANDRITVGNPMLCLADSAAAQLGISRRLVAYYASGRPIPRHIALAYERLDQVLAASVRGG